MTSHISQHNRSSEKDNTAESICSKILLWKSLKGFTETFPLLIEDLVTHSDDASRPAIVAQVIISQILALSMAEGLESREEGWVLGAQSNLDREGTNSGTLSRM